MFTEENINDHAENTVCYILPLQKRHHPPIKVLKNTTHIQNVYVLCRQHWSVERTDLQNIYLIYQVIFFGASMLQGHKRSKTMKTFYKKVRF
jgi:hypothetical protein